MKSGLKICQNEIFNCHFKKFKIGPVKNKSTELKNRIAHDNLFFINNLKINSQI